MSHGGVVKGNQREAVLPPGYRPCDDGLQRAPWAGHLPPSFFVRRVSTVLGSLPLTSYCTGMRLTARLADPPALGKTAILKHHGTHLISSTIRSNQSGSARSDGLRGVADRVRELILQSCSASIWFLRRTWVAGSSVARALSGVGWPPPPFSLPSLVLPLLKPALIRAVSLAGPPGTSLSAAAARPARSQRARYNSSMYS